MRRLLHWFIHRRGWSMDAGRIIWRARCGKLMCGDICTCGLVINVRPKGEELGEVEV